MMYKRLPDIEFAWDYNELQALPIFMREEIYQILDEFVEEENKRRQAGTGMVNGAGF